MSPVTEEAATRLFTFPRDSPETWALYVSLVYTGKVPSAMKGEIYRMEAEEARRVLQGEHSKLFGLYLQAERLNDAELPPIQCSRSSICV